MNSPKQKLAILTAEVIVRLQNMLLSLVRNLLFSKTARSAKQPCSILLFRSSALGDFICCLPTLRLLRKHFPKTKIVLLTIPSANPRWRNKIIPGGMFLANHLIDEKLLIQGAKLANWAVLKDIRSRIKSLDPEICMILPFSGERFIGRLKKLIYMWILGIRRNVYGIHMESSLSFFRNAQFAAGKFKHQIMAAISSLEEVGIQDQEVVFDINITPEDAVIVDRWWKENKLADHKVVAIHPVSKHKVNQWPIENFKLLGQMLLESNPNIMLIVVGGREEDDIADLLVKSWTGAVSFAGKATLMQSAEILRRSSLFVGSDSGPMHLAAAVKTPVVAIFSSTKFPVFWKPWGESSKVIRHSVPCEFCFTKDDSDCPTGTYECIRGISVEEVLDACLCYLR